MAISVVAREYGQPDAVLEVTEVTVGDPGPGQVVVDVRAVGTNPIDVKTVQGAVGKDESKLPLPVGFEVSGVVAAVGPEAATADGPISVGDEVVVYRADGGYTDTLLADQSAVHPKPGGLDHEHAAGLLLAGVAAADAVRTAHVGADDVVLIHGGSGAVGVIAIQLARKTGATVIATASPANHDHVAALGAIPVAYGDGLLDRVRAAAPAPVTAVVDTAGTDEAIDASLALLDNPGRIVSIAAFGRASDGVVVVNGSTPQSKEIRATAIPELLADAASGALVTEIAKTFPLTDAATALTELARDHPRGKFILIP
ncbi:NADP-dependent oxidoreductase [Gordonia soli]|uniref:Putative oxidoreductase n=1 Tax=Gordonia soli NBRC 108243 TaxID=1223545 RepID=M0QE03_9ACTN|nr:NADP-dependent oxidoreductase [Gordonia soli]GAC66674.1 putative oxidoreductase [Gordonia soli NBRC 108243]